jgi:hypothetical protein
MLTGGRHDGNVALSDPRVDQIIKMKIEYYSNILNQKFSNFPFRSGKIIIIIQCKGP